MKSTVKKSLPQISVVVPAYNEETTLPMCLQSLKDQDAAGRVEIIVVDNGSTDLTPRIAELYGARVIRQERRGVAFARQAGFEAASAPLICSTDADTVVPRTWLRRIGEKFRRDSALVAAGGRIEFIGVNSWLKVLIDFFAPAASAADYLMTGGGSLYGANFAVRRDAFLRAGGFNTALVVGEDVDLSQRLRRIGKVKIYRDMTVKTSARRFSAGLGPVIRYSVVNYLALVLHRESVIRFAEAVREPTFEAFGGRTFVSRWMIVAGVGALVAFGAGAFPFINMDSVSRAHTTERVIALTFDDGPNTPNTNQILEILRQKGVRATFFLIGRNVAREPDTAMSILAAGHLIGNHSESHVRRAMAGPPGKIITDVSTAERAICAAAGVAPRFFRPPYGYRTFWGDRALKKAGYVVVTWNDMTTDYWGISPDRIVRSIVARARPGGIIVLHDGSQHEPASRDNTVAALPEIIDRLRAQGYRFVLLDELLNQPPYFPAGCSNSGVVE